MKCATCGAELTTADPPGSWQCFGCREAARILAYSPPPWSVPIPQCQRASSEAVLRERLIDFVQRHDGEENVDELKYILEETQWW